jgi:integrase
VDLVTFFEFATNCNDGQKAVLNPPVFVTFFVMGDVEMARISKEKAADNARRALRLKRSKAGAGKGVYLRKIDGDVERYDITVEGKDGKKRVRHLAIPTTSTNDYFKAEVDRIRREIEQTEQIEFDDTIEGWINAYIHERKLVENSIVCFRNALRGFSLDPEENKRRVWEIEHSGLKQGTQRVKLKHVKALFAFITSHGRPIENPVVGKIRDGEPRTRVPSKAEIATLIQSVENTGSIIDQLYVRLLIATGARCSTIECVRPCDMDGEWQLQLYNKKLRRKYSVKTPIVDDTIKELWEKVVQGVSLTDLIFDHKCHNRLLERMSVLFPKDCNGESLSPHSLRRAFSTELARSGVPVKTAATMLDASPAVMVRHYITVQQDEVDAVMAQMAEKRKRELPKW